MTKILLILPILFLPLLSCAPSKADRDAADLRSLEAAFAASPNRRLTFTLREPELTRLAAVVKGCERRD